MSSIRKTVCDFCLNGCNLGVSFNGYQYRVEYLTGEAPNYGRLCPRGNSASILIDHPKRLCYPLLDGKEISWRQAIELIGEWRQSCRSDEIAVVYSRGLTEEELGIVGEFAQQLGTGNLICGYLEPDRYLGYGLEGARRANLDDVAGARAILLVGDVFGVSPVAAGFILNARYADKTSRLVVVDSIRTKQAGFAHLFVQVQPGTEYRALAAIAGVLDPKLRLDVDRLAGECGVERRQLEEAATIMKSAPNGLVGAAAGFGRVSNPLLHSLCAQLVALKTNKPFAGFAEAFVPEGKVRFGQFCQQVAQGKIRLIFWFGGLYPYSYPEVLPELSKVQFRVATSIFRFNYALPGLLLPVPSEFEKASEGGTLWRRVAREPVANPVSGSRTIAEICAAVAGRIGAGSTGETPRFSLERTLELLAVDREQTESDGYQLIGERLAIGLGEFYDSENEILLNPTDARKLEVKDSDIVLVKSQTAEQRFEVKVSGSVPAGAAAVGVDAHKNRRLFSVKFDGATGIATIPPAKVEIWRVQE